MSQHLRCAGAWPTAAAVASSCFFLELASQRLRRVGGLCALQLPVVKWSVRPPGGVGRGRLARNGGVQP